ncbi:uncharacterized protein [Littorina saxatilis]|uniref:Autophagy-related protein 27 n=1 Tax=Littorina saxatilis TaxID=31220 RepID=A0AAN9GHG5_9CAEN
MYCLRETSEMKYHKCLMFLIVGQLWSLCYSAGESCKKLGPCSCQSDKGTIDLSPLKGSPKFQDKKDAKGAYLFSYNPCTPFDEGKGCKKVSACQISLDKKTQFPTGTQDSASFSDNGNNNIAITYTATSGDATLRTTIVTLKCDKSGGEDKLDVDGETSPATYTMTLTSSHCCPKSGPSPPSGGGGGSGTLSIGSVMLIVVLALLVVYVAAGVGIQKGVRKASGKETFPNYTFWSSLPGFIKDGMIFTCSRCKRGSSYDQI